MKEELGKEEGESKGGRPKWPGGQVRACRVGLLLQLLGRLKQVDP